MYLWASLLVQWLSANAGDMGSIPDGKIPRATLPHSYWASALEPMSCPTEARACLQPMLHERNHCKETPTHGSEEEPSVATSKTQCGHKEKQNLISYFFFKRNGFVRRARYLPKTLQLSLNNPPTHRGSSTAVRKEIFHIYWIFFTFLTDWVDFPSIQCWWSGWRQIQWSPQRQGP